MRFRCLIHSGVSSVRWIRSHMEDWPVLLITHFAWKWQRIFLWARSTSSDGCQRTQRSPHGGTTPFMNTEHKPWSTRWTWYRTSSSKQSTTLQRLKWHCREACEWPKQCQREETVRLVPMCLCQCVYVPPSRGQKAPLGIHKAVSCICHPGRSTLGESTKLSLAYVTVTSRGAAHWGIHTLYWRSHHFPLPSPLRIHWKIHAM